ncbi:Uncharacterised protein [Neisseria animaloris]|uniref:DUF4377 domain-containing protein n=1 Tax=Neisseria animaloris TaxID=326522 RepID=UPI000A1972F3|nr:DUF4377 domain-containing protein [Neisseria animaloris]VEH86397.1 Uncharacterised protein [Neisseria animaloris]
MNIFHKLTCLLTVAAGACTISPASSDIYWVSGTKAECSAGAGKMMCLRVSKHPDLQQADWQYFYAPIKGFVFEEGILKKIEVRKTELVPETLPADASSIRYTLVRELEKRPDNPELYR